MGSIGKSLNVLVLTAILPALAIILFFGLEQRRHSIRDAKHEVMLLAKAMAEVQNGVANSTRQLFTTLAHMPDIRNMNAPESNSILEAVTRQNPLYLNITALDPRGEVFASGRPFSQTNLADRKHVREAVARREFAAGEYVIARISHELPSFTFGYPVLDEQGELRVILSAALRLESFAQFFDVTSLPRDSFISVTDHQGIRLFLYPPREGSNPVGERITPRGWEVSRGAEDPGISIHEGSDGVRRIFAYQPVRLRPEDPPYMYMWASMPEATVLAPANAALARNLVFMLLATLMALIASRLIGQRTLILPIKRLVAATQELARGNLDVRSRLEDTRGEIGALARVFDEMADDMARNQEKLRTIADYTYDWEYWLDPGGNPLWVSPSCERISGYTADEFMADRNLMKRIVHEEDVSLFEQHLEDTASCGCALHVDFRIIHRSGAVVWIDHDCIPIFSPDGSPLGRRVSNRDITERKRAEEERERLQVQLREAQKIDAVGRLAGGVAHDFNNMLGVILGYAEMILEESDPKDPHYNGLREIQTAAARSADLTRQLLAFARKQTVSPRVLDLNETVSGMAGMLRRLIGENIDLAWMPGHGIWKVNVDPSQVDQILANLVVNARDAIAQVGRITIRTENAVLDDVFCGHRPGCVPGDYVLLSVSDNGSGMSRKVLDHIFEPFFTTKGVGKGTGLGLATVYGIVKQNQGFVHVYSEPGQGTTFRIYIPRFGGEAGPVCAEATAAAPPGGTETVLIVEDEEAILNLGRTILERLGYTVLAADSPARAIQLVREYAGDIQLLVTDVVMPEMNGRDLAERLAAVKPGLKCLYMSGYTADVIAHHGVLDEDIDFIQKPFTTKALAVQVRRVLGEEALQDERVAEARQSTGGKP